MLTVQANKQNKQNNTFIEETAPDWNIFCALRRRFCRILTTYRSFIFSKSVSCIFEHLYVQVQGIVTAKKYWVLPKRASLSLVRGNPKGAKAALLVRSSNRTDSPVGRGIQRGQRSRWHTILLCKV